MQYSLLPYNQSLALLTDLYELTMGYGYWKHNLHGKEAVFNLFFRENPFHGGYTICAGLELALDILKHFRFTSDDLDYLKTLNGVDGKPLFHPDFLQYLSGMKLQCEIFAIEEGTVVFPHQPLVRVKGPLLQAQILETMLLNIINYQSLIATKASRICFAAKGSAILEFGARRAQGIDGSLSASRAAYIGGCAATSNVLAGKMFGIPVKGTIAHSWVMSFDNELESFEAFAEAMPNNCVLLVDTYNTIEGVKNAIKVGLELESKNIPFLGIRLDSGDLAYLSVKARELLDQAGLIKAQIYASNDLDENIIETLNKQGAKIMVWGVGTKLVTSTDQPYLGGVYKLAAIKKRDHWKYTIKLSEQSAKVNTPGFLQVRRFFNDQGQAIADAIYDEPNPPAPGESWNIVHPIDVYRQNKIPPDQSYQDLLIPVFQDGQVVYQSPDLSSIRERTFQQLGLFHDGVKRFINPHSYPAGLEKRVYHNKMNLISKIRGLEL